MNKFVGRNHRLAVEVLNCGVELVFQSRIPFESSLIGKRRNFVNSNPIAVGKRYLPYVLAEKLSENSHELVIHKAGTFESRFFDTLNLLLDDDFESSSSDEKCRR